MINVETDIQDDMLTLRVDLTRRYGLSKSGKSIIVASTQGNRRLYDESNEALMIGLNVYRYAEEGRS